MIAFLSPSIHKSDDVIIHSGLSASFGYEQIGPELTAERLKPNGLSNRKCHTPWKYLIVLANRST